MSDKPPAEAVLRVLSYNVHRWGDDRTALARVVKACASAASTYVSVVVRLWSCVSLAGVGVPNLEGNALWEHKTLHRLSRRPEKWETGASTGHFRWVALPSPRTQSPPQSRADAVPGNLVGSG
jgi:hypothetical protein